VRRFALVGALACLVASTVPAEAKNIGTEELRWSAPWPCAAACPWTTAAITGEAALTSSNGNTEACKLTPLTVADSWDDIGVTVPAKIGQYKPVQMTVTMAPTVDYELWICKVSGKGAMSFKARGKVQSGQCEAEGVGCPEKVTFNVKPGEGYILRAYHVADVAAAYGKYWYKGVRI